MSNGVSASTIFVVGTRSNHTTLHNRQGFKQSRCMRKGLPGNEDALRKYASKREKAHMDVVRKRERRIKAHERRERLHAQFYGEKWSEDLYKEVSIITERLEKSEERLRDSEPSIHLLAEEEWSPCERTTMSPPPTTANDTVPLVDSNLCAEQLRLIKLVLSGVNVFYTGGAGTGKSTVLRALVKELQQRGRHVQVVTPTGISALNVGGSTYFTWAGWNPGVMKSRSRRSERWRCRKSVDCG